MDEVIKWIDANIDKPDSDITVLIAIPSPGEPVWFGYFDDEKDEWFTPDHAPLSYQVTHWAEMPGGPKT